MAEIALTSLKICIQHLYDDMHSRQETARYVTDLGYEGCAEIADPNGQDGGNIDADRVKNVLCQVVINKCFAKRVDLTTVPPDRQGLKKLLCDSLLEHRMVPFFNIPAIVPHDMTSPLDFIKNNILKSCATQTFLKKFIACQFQLKWKTPNGWNLAIMVFVKLCGELNVMALKTWSKTF